MGIDRVRALLPFLLLIPLALAAQTNYDEQARAIEQLLAAGRHSAAHAQAEALIEEGRAARLDDVTARGRYLLGRVLLLDPASTAEDKIAAVKSLRRAALDYRRAGELAMVDSITLQIERGTASDTAPPPLPIDEAPRGNDSLENSAFNAILRLQNQEIESLTDSQVRQLYLLERQGAELSRLEMDALADSLQLIQQSQEISMQEAVIEAERLRRNILFVGGLGILMLLTLLYSRYLSTKRFQEKLRTEKERSDELLLNILPAPVAQELMEKGHATARRYDEVSVLFADFKGFSVLSANLAPEELVRLLDEAFQAFDGIVAAFGLEKIKTIGDAYMCAAGLPQHRPDHAEVAVRAALEMQHYLDDSPHFQARIGIHSGPVVAGVVGRDKFAYDIWGDTVNQAARLEAAGEVGEVTISKRTCELIGEAFNCEHVGTFEAKNIGVMDRFRIIGEPAG